MPHTSLFWTWTEVSSIKEPLTLKTASELQKLTHQLTKHNGKADEDRLLANPTPSTINREAAKVDNATSGPGLRKGSTRAKSPTRRQRDKEKGAQEILDGENEGEETGWGGFPVKKPYASLDNSDLPGGAGIVTRGEVESHGLNIGEMTTTEGVMEAAGLEGMAKEGVTSPDLNIDKAVMTADKEPVIGEKVGIESSTATDQAHDVEDFKAMLATAEIPLEAGKPVDSPLENFNTNYYFHAQQAYILASLGGLRGALEATPDEEAGPRSAIGRSLFLALDITTWEEDADVILEVGWAAVWWQQKLEAVEEEEAGFEEMQDRGHCV